MNIGYEVVRRPNIVLLHMPCRRDVKIGPADWPQNICLQSVCKSPDRSRALDHGEIIVPHMLSW